MKTRVAAAGLVVLAILVGAFAYLSATRRHGRALPSVGIVEPVAPSTSAQSTEPTPPQREATIYTVNESHGDENDLAPTRVPLMDPHAPARSAIDALIENDHSPLPEGTRLRGIKIDGGTATVDFSSEFQRNFHGGDLQEAQAVNSVLMTLGQFRTIDRVQILVDGSPIDSLGGHFELSEPVDVVRPGSSSQQAKNE